MRDPLDVVTAELPTLPPGGPDPAWLTIKARRHRCGYKGPKEAPACRGCLHLGAASLDTPGVCCTLHDFSTQLGAICSDWTPRE